MQKTRVTQERHQLNASTVNPEKKIEFPAVCLVCLVNIGKMKLNGTCSSTSESFHLSCKLVMSTLTSRDPSN